MVNGNPANAEGPPSTAPLTMPTPPKVIYTVTRPDGVPIDPSLYPSVIAQLTAELSRKDQHIKNLVLNVNQKGVQVHASPSVKRLEQALAENTKLKKANRSLQVQNSAFLAEIASLEEELSALKDKILELETSKESMPLAPGHQAKLDQLLEVAHWNAERSQSLWGSLALGAKDMTSWHIPGNPNTLVTFLPAFEADMGVVYLPFLTRAESVKPGVFRPVPLELVGGFNFGKVSKACASTTKCPNCDHVVKDPYLLIQHMRTMHQIELETEVRVVDQVKQERDQDPLGLPHSTWLFHAVIAKPSIDVSKQLSSSSSPLLRLESNTTHLFLDLDTKPLTQAITVDPHPAVLELDIRPEDFRPKRFQCQVCFRRYTYKLTLKKHVKLTHPNHPDEMKRVIGLDEVMFNRRPCAKCGKILSPRQMARHLKKYCKHEWNHHANQVMVPKVPCVQCGKKQNPIQKARHLKLYCKGQQIQYE